MAVQNRAFVFSLEAALSLVLLAGILVMQAPAEKKDLRELLVFQKENDLLKLWAKQQKFSLEEMRKDFVFAFPNSSGEITVNEKALLIGKKTGTAISSEITFFGSEMEKISVSVSVFEQHFS